ncbi:hypothetical protein, partial [Phocaeicola vulgatus]|uniref:hypothetical protein n=1 Tax=Phocaeicola vulgatus TaxID=821 RepID=UPI001C700898
DWLGYTLKRKLANPENPLTHYYSGMLMPSCSHFTYNNLIINILHDYSKNICSHLCPHTLTIF